MTKLTTQLLQALSTSAKLLLLLMLASFPVSARAEIEISAYGGYQTAPHSDVRTDLLGDDFVKWLGKSFDMPPYYGLRATYWQDHGWGYGFEANHAKVYADDPAS
jgi:lipid A oxidase